MIRYLYPEMFYLFIPFFIILILLFYKWKTIKNRLDNLGSDPVNNFLLNRIKYKIRNFNEVFILKNKRNKYQDIKEIKT